MLRRIRLACRMKHMKLLFHTAGALFHPAAVQGPCFILVSSILVSHPRPPVLEPQKPACKPAHEPAEHRPRARAVMRCLRGISTPHCRPATHPEVTSGSLHRSRFCALLVFRSNTHRCPIEQTAILEIALMHLKPCPIY